MLDDLAADRQAQPGALRLGGHGVADLAELLENGCSGPLRRCPVPLSSTSTRTRRSRPERRTVTLPAILITEFDRIRQQVQHDLDQAIAIRPHGWAHDRRQGHFQGRCACRRTAGGGRRAWIPRSPRCRSMSAVCHSALPGLDLGHVEHLVDEAGQALGFLDDDGEELLAVRPGWCFGSSSRISEKARIEVSGVRSSCVTVEMKSSFMRSSSFSRSLAARSSAVAASSSRDFCSAASSRRAPARPRRGCS
jgi:hypothetical protein